MTKPLILCVLFLSIVGVILGGALNLHLPQLTLKNGNEYLDVTVTEKTPEGIRIRHKYGLGLVPFDQLPDALVLQLGGFDPDEAKAAKKARDARDAKARRRLVVVAEEATRIAAEQAMLAAAKRDHAANLQRFSNEREKADAELRRKGTGRSYLKPAAKSTIPRAYTSGSIPTSPPRSRAPSSSSSQGESQRCAGNTTKGFRCMRMTTTGSYCYQHP